MKIANRSSNNSSSNGFTAVGVGKKHGLYISGQRMDADGEIVCETPAPGNDCIMAPDDGKFTSTAHYLQYMYLGYFINGRPSPLNNGLELIENCSADGTGDVFLTTYMVLNDVFKDLKGTNRKRKSNNNDGSNSSNGTTMNDIIESAEKFTKYRCIPKCILNSTHVWVKLALMVFLMTNESLRSRLLVHLYTSPDDQPSGEEVRNLCSEKPGEIKAYLDKNLPRDSYIDKTAIKALVRAFMIISNTLKLTTFAKMAEDLDSKIYYNIIRVTNERPYNNMTSLQVLDPIISLYIDNMVANVSKKQELTKLINQLSVNPKTIINSLLPIYKSTKVDQEDKNSSPLDPNREYEYYSGPFNFAKDLVTSYVVSDNRCYSIVEYNDCLYDVTGCINDYHAKTKKSTSLAATAAAVVNGSTSVIVPTSAGALVNGSGGGGGSSSNNNNNGDNTSSTMSEYEPNEIYCRDPWSARLELVSMTKIILRKALGSEIMKMYGHDVAVEWCDSNGLYRKKFVTVRKSNKKSKKSSKLSDAADDGGNDAAA